MKYSLLMKTTILTTAGSATNLLTKFLFGTHLIFELAVWAAPCPAETPLYGGALLDGSPDEWETYFAVEDDDLSIMVSLEFCT